jgi:hypothetical protein
MPERPIPMEGESENVPDGNMPNVFEQTGEPPAELDLESGLDAKQKLVFGECADFIEELTTSSGFDKNTIAFIKKHGPKIAEAVAKQFGHGDISHFNPKAAVEQALQSSLN